MRDIHVLVVDDDPLSRKLLYEVLGQAGFSVECAVNGREGLDKFKRGKFDLVITDGSMPEMSGLQMVKLIKQSAPDVPVVMVSGYGDEVNKSGRMPEGVDAIVGKPVAMSALREVMEGVLKKA